MPFPTLFYTAARESHLPLVPSTALHRCRREPSAICSQHILKLLQERICFQRFPARPGTAAGENPLSLVPSKALHRCRREPSAIGSQHILKLSQERICFQRSPARPGTAAGENPLPLIASKALHRCRREPSAIGAQQGLASLQERTLCHWSPAQHQSVAGGNLFCSGSQQDLAPLQERKFCHRTCCHVLASVLVYIPICSGGGWPIGGVELPLAKRCTSPTSKNLNEASRPMFYGFLENMCFDAYSLGFNAQCLQRRVPRCDWWRWCLAAAVVAIVAWLAS